MIESKILGVGTELMNRGLLDVSLPDFVGSEHDFVEGISEWDLSTPFEMKVSGSSSYVIRHVPFRTNINVLNKLLASAKTDSRRSYTDIAYLYQIGFIVPHSSVLSQAWGICFLGDTPEIGGRSIELVELIDEFEKHIEEAFALSSNSFHLYPHTYYQNLSRFTSVLKDSDVGFATYAYNSRFDTYELSDAYIKDPKSGNLINAFGFASCIAKCTLSRKLELEKQLEQDAKDVEILKQVELGLIEAPDQEVKTEKKEREPRAQPVGYLPVSIGKFSVKDRSARILIPFGCEYPELSDEDWNHLRQYDIFEAKAFFGTKSVSDTQRDNLNSSYKESQLWIDSTYSVTMNELISTDVRKSMDRAGHTAKAIRLKRREILDENKVIAKDCAKALKAFSKECHAELAEFKPRRKILVGKIRAKIKEFADRAELLKTQRKPKTRAKLIARMKEADASYIRRLKKFDRDYANARDECELKIEELRTEHLKTKEAGLKRLIDLQVRVDSIRFKFTTAATIRFEKTYPEVINALRPETPDSINKANITTNKQLKRTWRKLNKELGEETELPTYLVELTKEEVSKLVPRYRRRLMRFYRKRLKFIDERTSDAYNQSILLVDAREKSNRSNTRLDNIRIREIAEELEATDNEKKTIRLTREDKQLHARADKRKDLLARDMYNRKEYQSRIEQAQANKLVLKSVKEYGEELFVKPARVHKIHPAEKFDIYPTALHCISSTKSAKLQKGAMKRLSSVGFKLKTVK